MRWSTVERWMLYAVIAMGCTQAVIIGRTMWVWSQIEGL